MDINRLTGGPLFTEYIYKIDEDESDESEVFTGYIRKHSQRLIRCKDCVHHITCLCEFLDYIYTEPDFFCAWGEEK